MDQAAVLIVDFETTLTLGSLFTFDSPVLTEMYDLEWRCKALFFLACHILLLAATRIRRLLGRAGGRATTRYADRLP